MSILDEARKAISLISSGRSTLSSLVQQVKEGKHAVDADTQAELDAMLAHEEEQTKAVIADVRDAIAEYRAGN